ncbi:MAG TPA: hypothetical protein VEA81_01150 [Burkholderiaceae bacterium]|nr:hypothetical protein [Burkholderiaceae bacterium]
MQRDVTRSRWSFARRRLLARLPAWLAAALAAHVPSASAGPAAAPAPARRARLVERDGWILDEADR